MIAPAHCGVDHSGVNAFTAHGTSQCVGVLVFRHGRQAHRHRRIGRFFFVRGFVSGGVNVRLPKIICYIFYVTVVVVVYIFEGKCVMTVNFQVPAT